VGNAWLGKIIGTLLSGVYADVYLLPGSASDQEDNEGDEGDEGEEEDDEEPEVVLSDEEDSFPYSPYVDMGATVRRRKKIKPSVRFAPIDEAHEMQAELIPLPANLQPLSTASSQNVSPHVLLPSPVRFVESQALVVSPAFQPAADRVTPEIPSIAAQVQALFGPPAPRQMNLKEFFPCVKPTKL